MYCRELVHEGVLMETHLYSLIHVRILGKFYSSIMCYKGLVHEGVLLETHLYSMYHVSLHDQYSFSRYLVIL